ncbi:hypothetical protein [Kineococcus terrestris]|uniref:hypothetical protein n=1 Tax=Kineococcus terrestris TaxID=2044856 RepID=UPI0034DB1DF8
MLTVSVRPRHLLAVLLAVTAVLVVTSYAFLLATVALGVDAGAVVSARKFVDVNNEQNLPAWYSAMLLCVAGLVTLEVGRRAVLERRRFRWHWVVLGAGFLYLSLDELVALHEKFVEPMTAVVGSGGVFAYAWVAAALPAVAVVALAFLGFLRALPRRTAALVLLGGALYVGGAVGMEMVANLLTSAGVDEGGMLYGTLQTIEEAMEMAGPAVYLYAVAAHTAARSVALPAQEVPASSPAQSRA